MDIWKILGIPSTKDKDALKKAYRERLSCVNPEDDAEGFMELRKAYEEALRLADTEEKTEDNEDDSELIRAFKELYQDFYKRIDIKFWEELFNRDEFVSLDTSEDAGNELLKFLMTNIYLPKKVWKYIVDMLDIVERKKELVDIFPEDFIDYILNNSEFDDMISYELFDGDESQFDEYIENYYRLDVAIRKRDFDAQATYIDKLESLDVYHPYLSLSKIRREIQLMNAELEIKNSKEKENYTLAGTYGDRLLELEEEVKQIKDEFPEDLFAINTCGDIKMLEEHFEEAKEYYDMAGELAPDNYIVKGKQAEILYYLKEYEKSRDMYMELLKLNHFDNNVRAGMIRANQGLIETLGKKLEEEPDNNKLKLEISWSLYQSYRFGEALELLTSFEPDDGQECEYFNLKGRTFLCVEEYEKSLECFTLWRKYILEIPEDDTTKESLDKKKRYEYVNFLIGDCYLKTRRYDEARKYLEIALRKEHDEIVLSYEAMCELEYETCNYEACLTACETLLVKDTRSYIGYNYMSKAYYKMDYLRDSLKCCEHAIALYPYVADPYVLEVNIYLKVNQTDVAQSVIDRYRKYGIDSDKIDFSQACIYESLGKREEIIKLLSDTIKCSDAKSTDMDNFYELHMMLGFHMDKSGDKEGAKKLYESVIESCPDHHDAYGMLARIVRDEGDYKSALELYDKQLSIKPGAFYYIQRGLLHKYLMNYKSALSDFKMALDYEPGNVFCYMKLGEIYELHGEFDDALENYSKGIMYCDRPEDNEQLKTLIISKARILQCVLKFDESKASYDEYIEKYGFNADMAYDYSELLFRMNKPDCAFSFLLKAVNELTYDEDVQACIRHLCYLYGCEGYIDKANETMMLAISHDDKDKRAYAVMGEVFFNHGLLDDARSMYTKAVDLDTDNSRNYYSELIEVILAKKSFFKPDVRELVKKAIIPPEQMRLPDDYVKMARLNRVLKKYTEAIKIIDKAIKMKRCRGCFYGKCHEALYEKGLIYEAMKQYKKAHYCYKQALHICGHNPLYEESIKRVEGK